MAQTFALTAAGENVDVNQQGPPDGSHGSWKSVSAHESGQSLSKATKRAVVGKTIALRQQNTSFLHRSNTGGGCQVFSAMLKSWVNTSTTT
jgi:hypothetical protein